MNLNNNQSTFDRGISPVIGVILMVVITVVLGAIVANYMLDFGDQASEQSPSAAVTFEQSDSEVSVTIQTIKKADEIYWKVKDGSGDDVDPGQGSWIPLHGPNNEPNVGDSLELKYGTKGNTRPLNIGETITIEPNDTIVIMGELDGNREILQSYTVE